MLLIVVFNTHNTNLAVFSMWYNSSPDIRTLQLKGHTSNQAIYQMYWDHRWRVTDEEITDEGSQMKRSQMKSHRWRDHRWRDHRWRDHRCRDHRCRDHRWRVTDVESQMKRSQMKRSQINIGWKTVKNHDFKIFDTDN